MEQLRSFNSRQLYKVLDLSDSDFIKWLQQLNLLNLTKKCECGGEMSYKWDSARQNPKWRCTKKICRKVKGFFSDTWFEGAHLTVKEVYSLLSL